MTEEQPRTQEPTTEETAAKKPPRRVQLTERDLETLRWIGEQYVIRLDQLQRVLGERAGARAQTPGMVSERAARVWIERMQAISAVEQEKPYRSQPLYVWLTGAGLRLIELDFTPLKPATSTLTHLYWINQTRLYMAAKRPGDRWIPERQLRSEQRAKQTSLREPETPDAHLLTPKGPIAIEVELSVKQEARLIGLVRRRVSQYYTVWYFCSQQTQPHVEAAKKQLAADVRERIQIYNISQLK